MLMCSAYLNLWKKPRVIVVRCMQGKCLPCDGNVQARKIPNEVARKGCGFGTLGFLFCSESVATETFCGAGKLVAAFSTIVPDPNGQRHFVPIWHLLYIAPKIQIVVTFTAQIFFPI